jgi:hypothetical protein
MASLFESNPFYVTSLFDVGNAEICFSVGQNMMENNFKRFEKCFSFHSLTRKPYKCEKDLVVECAFSLILQKSCSGKKNHH